MLAWPEVVRGTRNKLCRILSPPTRSVSPTLSGGLITQNCDNTMTELEPIDPKLALELYLDDRRSHQSKATTIAHRSRLSSFIDWLDERDIDNLNELTGRRVKEYKLHRRKESDWASSTEKSNLDTICVFVRWAEGIEAVEANLSQRVQSPVLNGDENVRHTELDSETAEKVLSHLETYQYCSPQHVTLALIWHTMSPPKCSPSTRPEGLRRGGPASSFRPPTRVRHAAQEQREVEPVHGRVRLHRGAVGRLDRLQSARRSSTSTAESRSSRPRMAVSTGPRSVGTPTNTRSPANTTVSIPSMAGINSRVRRRLTRSLQTVRSRFHRTRSAAGR